MKGKCMQSPCIRVPILENLFLQALHDTIKNPELFDAFLIPSECPVTRDYDADIRRLTLSLKRAKDAYLSGIDSLEEYKTNKQHFESEIAKTKEEKEKSSLPPKPDFDRLRERLLSAYHLLTSDADLEAKQACMENLVSKIIINGPDKSITPCFYY